MTTLVAIVPDVEAEIRWRKWEARGAEHDRRLAQNTRRFMFLLLLVAVGVLGWFSVRLG
jgi:hypothetical protein